MIGTAVFALLVSLSCGTPRQTAGFVAPRIVTHATQLKLDVCGHNRHASLGNIPLRRFAKASSVFMSESGDGASAVEGDRALAGAAASLASGELVQARSLLLAARQAYEKANVRDREDLVDEVSKRVEQASILRTQPRPPAANADEVSRALVRAKHEGDDLMAAATRALGKRDIAAARRMLEEAQELFERAGPAVARDREMILGNLRSSVLIEEEREMLAAKRAKKKALEEAEYQMLLQESLGNKSPEGSDTNSELNQDAQNDVLAAADEDDEEDDDDDVGVMEDAVCILVDNGSSRPASTLSLRSIASALQARIGVRVMATSLKHSDKAPVADLRGEPAVLLEQALPSTRARKVYVLPVFFGPSPQVNALVSRHSETHAHVGAHLGAGPDGVEMLAQCLVAELARVVRDKNLTMPPVIVVDHGSPAKQVAELRDAVAAAVREDAVASRLASSVYAASMERRPGDEYAFSDPLLDVCLRDVVQCTGQRDVVLCMMFLGNGTHAGAGGDIDQICAGVQGVTVHRTRVLGETQQLVDILEKRYREVSSKHVP